jgi:hypothetical protein
MLRVRSPPEWADVPNLALLFDRITGPSRRLVLRLQARVSPGLHLHYLAKKNDWRRESRLRADKHFGDSALTPLKKVNLLCE